MPQTGGRPRMFVRRWLVTNESRNQPIAARDWLTPSFVGAGPDGRKLQAHLESEWSRPGQGRPEVDYSPRNTRKRFPSITRLAIGTGLVLPTSSHGGVSQPLGDTIDALGTTRREIDRDVFGERFAVPMNS